VPTATFRVLFVFLVLSHDRRRLVHFAITEHPTPRNGRHNKFATPSYGTTRHSTYCATETPSMAQSLRLSLGRWGLKKW
jgi:hypothetical protein